MEMEMRKNHWFILFPEKTVQGNTWLIDDRSAAFDLELQLFEQFCFLKPKIPISKIRSLSFIESKGTSSGFPAHGLLDRCPKPSPEHCLKNGTRIRQVELLELKTFLTSTTTRKSKLARPKRTLAPKKRFIEPVW